MNDDTSSISLETTEKFIERVKVASRLHSKELRISLAEAEDISLTFSILMCKSSVTLEKLELAQTKIIELQQEIINILNNTNIDAGSF